MPSPPRGERIGGGSGIERVYPDETPRTHFPSPRTPRGADTESGQGGIRTRGRGFPLRRFSKPVPSAARPPVRPVWIIPPAPRPVNFRRGGRLAPRTCPSRRWTAGEVGPGRRRTPLAYPSVTMHQNPLFLTGQRLVGGTGGLYILWTGRNDRPCQRTQRDTKRWQRRKRRPPSRERNRR